MVKTINFEKSNFNISWTKNSYGLLIGNVGKQAKHINVFLPIECPTDPNQSKEESNVIATINPKWIAQHALNVFRMLPGNVTIVGCYAVVDPETFIKYESNLQSILFDVYLKERKLNYDLFENIDSTKIFLLLNPNNSKFTCKKIDLLLEKKLFKSVDVKYTETMIDYHTAQSNIAVKIDMIMPCERDKDLILKQLKDSVNPFIADFVNKSIMLINGQQLDPETEFGNQLDIQSDSAREIPRGDISGESSFVTNNSRLEIVFIGRNMQPLTESSLDSESEAEFEMINRVKIQGCIPGVAYLSFYSSMKDVEEALKKDFTRSLYSRLELLTEELHITSGEIEVSQMLLPQRVKVTLPCCPKLPLSDYKFFSETAADVISRVGYFCRSPCMNEEDLDINCIDMDIEKSEQASLDDELSEVELPEEHKDQNAHSINMSKLFIFLFCLSGLVLLIAIGTYFISN